MYSWNGISTLAKKRAILALVLLLSACEEGNSVGGSFNDLPESGPTNSGGTLATGASPYNLSEVNGPLKGDFWSTATGERINLDTGESKIISSNLIYPRLDGLEYIEHVEEFRFNDCYKTRSDAFIVRDSVTGLASDYFEFSSEIYGPIKMSHDGQAIAFYANSLAPCDESNSYSVFIVNRKGELIASSNEGVIGYDWLPDNRIVFMIVENNEYKLVVGDSAFSFSGTAVTSLTGSSGSPSRFRISPNGEQVLFEVVSGTPVPLTVFNFREATVWQMNLDGTNLRQVADTSRESLTRPGEYREPLVNEPVWSPDGQHILMTENYKSGGNFSFYGTQTENHTYIDSISVIPVNLDETTYVMPANTDFVRLPPAEYSTVGVRPLIAVNEWDDFYAVGVDPTKRQSWTPAVADSQSNTGEMPNPNGVINRGITGSLYYNPGDESRSGNPLVGVTDLGTGTSSTIELKTDLTDVGIADFTSHIAVSKSGNRITAIHSPRNSGYPDVLAVYDRQGNPLGTTIATETANYDFKAALYSTTKISPANENLVAWKYKNGIVILDAADGELDTFDDRPWDAFAWMPDGHLLLVDNADVYVANPITAGFLTPTLLFSHVESFPDRIAISPDGNNIAYAGTNGDIYMVGTDGKNYRRITAPTVHAFRHVAWSPDGKYLSSYEGKSRDNYIFSANAQNLKLYPRQAQHGFMRVNESAVESNPHPYHVMWR